MSGPGDPFEANAWDEPPFTSLERVMFAWEESVEREEPWCTMPVDDRRGELRRVLEELLDPANGIDAPTRRRRLETAAYGHGAFRRGQRCSEVTLSHDLIVLRDALKRALRAGGASHTTARDLVRQLLPDWHLARRAARSGYNEARIVRDSTS
ncbi:MAG TPA: hypothetical protein VGM82_24720 [Gemmatimonadaceae bacterium]|jgi:hypothetical protein